MMVVTDAPEHTRPGVHCDHTLQYGGPARLPPSACGAVTGRLRTQVRVLLASHRLLGGHPFVIGQMLPTFLSPATRANDPEAVAYLRARIAGLDRHAFATTMASVMLDREDLAGHVARLRMPTLFVTGADDAIWTPADVRAAESGVVSSTVIDGAAHLCALESPAVTANAILSHWDSPTRHR